MYKNQTKNGAASLLAVLLAASMAMTGCGSSSSTSTTAAGTTAAETTAAETTLAETTAEETTAEETTAAETTAAETTLAETTAAETTASETTAAESASAETTAAESASAETTAAAASGTSASAGTSSASADDSGTHTVVDTAGNSVEIPNEVDSIVVPFPAATQAVLGLGGADLLTGGYILDTDMNQKMFGDYFDKVTQIKPSEINTEVVMNCDPDFAIVASEEMKATFDSIEVPSLLYTGSDIPAMESNVNMIAEAIGTDEAKEKAAAYTDFYDRLSQEVSAMTEDIPDDEKPVVYVNTEDDPLCSHGKGSLVNEWVNLSGGQYVCDILNVEGGEVTITAEQLLNADPDIIICVTTAGRDAILNDDAYANIKAVKNNKIYVNPLGGSVWFKGHFEAPLELSWAPTIISPDYTADLDTRKWVDEFYQTFYGYTVTDEDFETIMNPSVGSR